MLEPGIAASSALKAETALRALVQVAPRRAFRLISIRVSTDRASNAPLMISTKPRLSPFLGPFLSIM